MDVGKERTRAGRLADYFRGRSGRWIDGGVLGQIAGSYAWRTRVSDLRRAPFYMQIENRLRAVPTDDGPITVSEYRFVPSTAGSGSDGKNDRLVCIGRRLVMFVLRMVARSPRSVLADAVGA